MFKYRAFGLICCQGVSHEVYIYKKGVSDVVWQKQA